MVKYIPTLSKYITLYQTQIGTFSEVLGLNSILGLKKHILHYKNFHVSFIFNKTTFIYFSFREYWVPFEQHSSVNTKTVPSTSLLTEQKPFDWGFLETRQLASQFRLVIEWGLLSVLAW